MQKRYVHGPGLDEPLVEYAGSGTTNRSYLLADERGSVIGVVNTAGTVTVNKYNEYGVPAATNQGRFQYTGQMWLSEVGLYHYKARAYHPRLGRFLQPDPIGYAGGMNLYGYAGNDPVNFTDPSGLVKWLLCDENDTCAPCPIFGNCFFWNPGAGFEYNAPPPAPYPPPVTFGGGGDTPSSTSPAQNCTMAQSIDAYLKDKKSVMAGLGSVFDTAGQVHDIDPRLLVALAGAETTFAKPDSMRHGEFNAFGYGINNKPPITFSSWLEAIITVTKSLSGAYSNQYDLTNTSTVYAQYCNGSRCPEGLTNINRFMTEQFADPNNLRYPLSRNAPRYRCDKSQ